jgi:hypothetical protein
VTGHPEADLLTAFAERSLSERERSTVLEHLSQCAECRDVVALALPGIDIAAPAPVPARRGWLGWPGLRWGLVAAGAVVVVSAGILKYQLRPGADLAKNSVPSPPQAVAGELRSEATPTPAAAPALAESHLELQPTLNDKATLGAIADAKRDAVAGSARPNRVPQVLRGNGFAGNAASGPHAPSQWQQNNSANVQANQAFGIAPPPSPAAETAPRSPTFSETVEVSSAAPAVQEEPQNRDSLDETARQVADLPVGKAKAATEDSGATAGAAPKSASPVTLTPMARTSLASATLAPTWGISATGGLQRSFDHGGTWQDVIVAANEQVMGANFASYEVTVQKSRAKEKDEEGKQALKKQITAPVFRAVAAVGADVWAGGQGGMLYHSQDSGNHWARVVPNAASSFLTGDVVGVEFSDPQHGKITTSVPEVWNTADGGQSWQKQ